MSELEARQRFYSNIATQSWSSAESVKEMRKLTNLTQIEFAKKLGIAPRIIIDIERGKGNPTVKTLQKIGKIFGLQPGFIRIRPL